jgi:hypothetical protein
VQILKSGNTNVYIVNSKVAWQTARGMRYASFNAQLIIDEKEQIKKLEEIIQDAEELLEVPIMDLAVEQEDEPLENETDPRQRDLLE